MTFEWCKTCSKPARRRWVHHAQACPRAPEFEIPPIPISEGPSLLQEYRETLHSLVFMMFRNPVQFVPSRPVLLLTAGTPNGD